MDIVTARTFLAIAESGTFARAAEQLFVTQSTVSSRIRVLEQELGARVFDRGKQGASLTAAGRRFVRHAEGIVRAWSQAQLSAGLPPNMAESLTLAAPATLWDSVLLPALPALREAMPNVAIRGELSNAQEIAWRLVAGTLDIALHYRPEAIAGISVDHLIDEELIFVSSVLEPTAQGEENAPYVYVDWGPVFQAEHARAWPDGYSPEIVLDIGALALGFLLTTPSSAYMPARNAVPLLAANKLREVPDAGRFFQPVYALSKQPAETLADSALQVLKRFCKGI